ncbi:MAG TPA: TrbI/VirB10 family protein [Croceibacterium sp.]|nr:TrbI/VirB10 family protein [Croceibacterium sp.]
MKLAMRLPEKPREEIDDTDPRDEATAEVIDLASRTAYPVVAQRKGKSDGLALAAGVGFVALLGAATLWGLNASRTGQPQQTAPVPAPVPAATAPALVEATAPAPDQGITPIPAAAMPAPAPAPGIQPVFAAQANPYASPTLIHDAYATPAAAPAGAPAVDAAAAQAVGPGGSSAGDFASRIGGVGGGPATAANNFDPKTTITQGTMIPAVLETAINTDVPGFVRAVVSQDVRSYDGTRILVPRSSRLIGQYQSGLQQGQKRAYVIWTRLIRPDGVSVSLASPATAFDGSGGLPGQVDSHFFQRFGSAMLLSVIGGLTTIASGGTSVILGGGQNAASTALQQNGQISPTVRVRMGEPIRVFTARDLDFSQAPQL